MDMNFEKMKASYCSLGEIPYKLFLNNKLHSMISNGAHFTPVHAVILPTNHCNLNCSFCNCANRDISKELPLQVVCEILDILKRLGTSCVTLSGGGEPTTHRNFNDILCECKKRGIKIGLVTNGILLDKLLDLDESTFSWIRISFGDGRDISNCGFIIDRAIELKKRNIVDTLGISYLKINTFDSELFSFVKKQTIRHDEIAYAKVLYDCFYSPNDYHENSENSTCSKIIYAYPNWETNLSEACYMPLIRPIFAADGYVYPCCDIQYHNNERNFESKNRYCFYSEYEKFISHQICFKMPNNGCVKCYHKIANDYLQLSINGVFDAEWI